MTTTSINQRFQEQNVGLFTDEKPPGVLVIPVDGFVKNNGKNPMGAFCGKIAKKRFKGLDAEWGAILESQGKMRGFAGRYKTEAVGNRVALIRNEPPIVAFPTHWFWWEPAKTALIDRSCLELLALTDHYKWQRVYLPRVGCGTGGLDWEDDVKPILLARLNDPRFIICTP